jgi:hypothetical protein
VSAEEQQRIIDEAEQQSAEIARLQEESGNKLEAILTAALLAVLPSVLRAYRRYTSVLTGRMAFNSRGAPGHGLHHAAGHCNGRLRGSLLTWTLMPSMPPFGRC